MYANIVARNIVAHSGLDQTTLDPMPNSLPTELRREICEVGFILLLYSAIV